LRQSDEVRILAVGDIQPDRSDPETLFEGVRPLFEWADLRFAQLECTISDKGIVRTDVRNPAHRVHPRNLAALKSAPFDLVSYAGNNNLDYGLEAFEDTLTALSAAGIKYVGAGSDIAEARSPVICEVQGTTLAFVNFCSILRDGYAAGVNRPGISPLRVSTFYEPVENVYEQPGTPARTVTMVDLGDMQAMTDAVTDAKARADVCIALFHWGVHFTHDLSPYQPAVAKAAIDAGADLVVGTHPHCLQGIDVYKGKVIFYSLGNFAFEQNRELAQHGVCEYLSFYGLQMDELANHPHPSHCRLTAAAKIVVRDKKIASVSVQPVYFADSGRPELLNTGDNAFKEIRTLLDDLSEEIGTRLEWNHHEALVVPEKDEPVDTQLLVASRLISYPRMLERAQVKLQKRTNGARASGVDGQ
jgi:poly-gamma-glutamate capsule biosynthesis protein CapA/YwtB (metallophosphatase superfamily)